MVSQAVPEVPEEAPAAVPDPAPAPEPVVEPVAEPEPAPAAPAPEPVSVSQQLRNAISGLTTSATTLETAKGGKRDADADLQVRYGRIGYCRDGPGHCPPKLSPWAATT